MIRYVRGDATLPRGRGPRVIAHVVNDLGAWGKGFVLAVSKRWEEPEAEYRAWHRERSHPEVIGDDKSFHLGATQLIKVDSNLYVANMLAQRGIKRSQRWGAPIRYDALSQCLEQVSVALDEIDIALNYLRGAKAPATLHMPRIGCGLAGGNWMMVGPIVERTLRTREVYVYDFGGAA